MAELFWPGATDPLNRLAVTLARLRRAETFTFADKLRVWTDAVTDAQALLTAVDEGGYEEAVALYRGPFLDGFYLKEVGAELEEWVYATREKVAGRVRTAQLRIAETVAAQGDFAGAATLAACAYRLPGAAELELEELVSVYRLLVAGSSSLAGEVRKEAQALGGGLSLTPPVARQQLAGGRRATPHNLTPPAIPFVGRGAELAVLSRKLRDPDCRLLTLDLEGFFAANLAETRQLRGYPEYLAAYLQHYATYLLHHGDPSRAQALARESQSLFERLGHERWRSGCLNVRGVAALKLGDLDEAEKLLNEALTAEEGLGKKFMQAATLSNVAKVATARGDYASAARHLKRSLQLGLDINNPFNLAATLVSLAELRIAQGETTESATWLALVAQHPNVEKHDRDEARRVLAGLRDRSPPAALEAAIARADVLTLEGLAGVLLGTHPAT